MEQQPHIFDQTIQSLKDWLKTRNQPEYKAKQIIHWVHHEQVLDPNLMTNLNKQIRLELIENFNWNNLDFAPPLHSNDGCIKWLLSTKSKSQVETVFIPEKSRGTLCISSQAGCSLACTFCSTGAQGFSGNLPLAEIIAQVWMAKKYLAQNDPEKKITNIVFMGMGEPLLNFKPVTAAVDLLLDDLAYGLSKYRVTISTSGIVPKMEQLKAISECSLAVSLHAPNDSLRDIIMPINKKHPLEELILSCSNYFKLSPKRKITFEYAMLKGVNDTPTHAKQLIKLLANCPGKINLIPFNPFPNTIYECSSFSTIKQFQAILQKAGINTTIRKTRGQDIDAACGQLAGKVLDKTTRTNAGKLYQKQKKESHKKRAQ